MENNKTMRPKSGRSHLWVEVVMKFTRGSGLSQGSHVTGKIFGALDRYRGFIKNLVAGER